MNRVFGGLLVLLLTEGCALTPRGISLHQRERRYNEALAHVTPGQTRADLNARLPPWTSPKPWITGSYKPPHLPFDAESYKIDPDFFVMVDFAYQRFRRVPEPVPLPPQTLWSPGFGYVTVHSMGNIRRFRPGTRYFRIYPQHDDRILSISRRVSRTDGDLIYMPRRAAPAG